MTHTRPREPLDFPSRYASIGAVKALRSSAMRHVLAALLMAVLTLTGGGRGLAVASEAGQAWQAIPGVVVPICHASGDTSTDPAKPGGTVHHDCCDQCVLCAAVLAAPGPELALVTPVSHATARSALVAWTVRVSRARTPRQSQGPPAA